MKRCVALWVATVVLGLELGCGASQPGDGSEAGSQALRRTQAGDGPSTGYLEILPGNLSVEPGVPVQFIARVSSPSGAGILHSKIKWGVSGFTGATIDDTGRFEATTKGTYNVTARSGSQSASITVTVGAAAPIESLTVVNRSGGPNLMAVNPPGDPSYDPSLDAAVLLPKNRRGPDPRDVALTPRPQPGTGPTPRLLTAGVSDYTFDLPLLSVPGRGLNLGLTLRYSANVWTINGAEADFDVDGDWPAPGFTLSFGKLIDTGAGVMFIDGNGTRHSYKCSSCLMGTAQYYSAYTTDGTLIDYNMRWDVNGPSSGYLYFPDGTRIDFGARGAGALYATKITDRNGNYITITYVNNRGPKISAIVDTVGRASAFAYDVNGNLQTITAPSLYGLTRRVAYFHYSNRAISTLFHAPITTVVVNGGGTGGTRWVLDAVVLSDGSGISMGDLASLYSPWGMVRQIDQRVGMSVDGAGNVNRGTLKRYSTYSFPSTTSPDPLLTKAPTYSSQSDYWVNNDTGVVVTSYSTSTSNGVLTTTVTRPDSSIIVRRASDDPAALEYGLTTQVQESGFGAGLLRQTDYTYVKGYHGAPMLKETLVTYFGAGASAPLRTVYTYNPGNPDSDLITSQIQQIDEYDYNKTSILRSTTFTYVSDSNYITNHVYNLIARRIVGPGVVERIDYGYDAWRGTALLNAPGVTQHSTTYDPYTNYQPISDFRGNLTSVTRYSNPATASGAVTASQRYDITGNQVWQQTEVGIQTNITYGSSYQYAYPTAATTGLSPNSYDTSATYDLGTGAPITAFDPTGSKISYFYDSTKARIDHTAGPTNLQVNFRYDDVNFTSTIEAAFADTGTVISRRVTTVNGLNVPTQTSDLSDAAGTVDLVRVQYDGLGRPWKQSLPYRNGDTVVYTSYAYDGLGRPASVTAPDGAVSTRTYQPSFVPSGQPTVGVTVLEKTAWQAERWLRSDALGFTSASYEAKNTTGPKAAVSGGGILTTWRHDIRGLLTQAYSAGASSQDFYYDGLRNLTCQALSERTRTLGQDGVYRGYTVLGDGTLAGQGTCSDVNKYDTSGRLVSTTDARGVVTNISYGTPADPLSRVQSMSYDASHLGDTAHPVLPAAATTYAYCTVGDASCPHRDVRLLRRETTSGVVTRDFAYDSFGRRTQVTSTVSGRTGTPLTVDYGYDVLGRTTRVTYPARYGFTSPSRRVVDATLAPRGRVTWLGLDGVTYAHGFGYGPNGAMQNVVLGPATGYQGQEIWDYEPVSGLIQRQRVMVGAPATTQMDLQYGYLLTGTDGSLGRTGKLTSVVNGLNSARNRGYTYDSLGRLRSMTSGTSTSPWSETYGYDDVGNRTTVTAAGGAVLDGLTPLAYTVDKRIQGNEYDPAGNLIQGKVDAIHVERFQYDAAGRLVSVTRIENPNVLLETYTYGSDRVRLSMTDGSGTKTYYATDGTRPLAEYSDTGSALQYARTRIYLGNRLIAGLRPSGSSESLEVYHYDRLGRRLVGTVSSVKEQVTLPYGTELDAESTTWTRELFTSYERSDTTRLDYAVNRFYLSRQSRFTQADPAGAAVFREGRSQSLNLYSYAGNDPINRTDLLGLWYDETPIYTPDGEIITVVGNGNEGCISCGKGMTPGDPSGGSGGGGSSGGGGGVGGGGAGGGKSGKDEEPKKTCFGPAFNSAFKFDIKVTTEFFGIPTQSSLPEAPPLPIQVPGAPFTLRTSLARTLIGISTAATTAETVGGMTLFQGVQAFEILAPVMDAGMAASIGGLVVKTGVVNAIAVGGSLGGGIVVGSAIDALGQATAQCAR